MHSWIFIDVTGVKSEGEDNWEILVADNKIEREIWVCFEK